MKVKDFLEHAKLDNLLGQIIIFNNNDAFMYYEVYIKEE